MSEIEKGLYNLRRTPFKVVTRLKPAKINASVKTFFYPMLLLISTTEIYKFASFDG